MNNGTDSILFDKPLFTGIIFGFNSAVFCKIAKVSATGSKAYIAPAPATEAYAAKSPTQLPQSITISPGLTVTFTLSLTSP